MVNNPKPDVARKPDQSTSSGLNGYTMCPQPSIRYDVRDFVTNQTMVQVEDWTYRFYANNADIALVSRV